MSTFKMKTLLSLLLSLGLAGAATCASAADVQSENGSGPVLLASNVGGGGGKPDMGKEKRGHDEKAEHHERHDHDEKAEHERPEHHEVEHHDKPEHHEMEHKGYDKS